MARRLRPLRVHREQGVLAPVGTGRWWQFWRDPNHLLLAAPWPAFLAMVTLGYGALNLLFALLYLLDPQGIGGLAGGRRAGFADAFFFSVQTLGSIGYGVLHPVPSSLLVNLLVTAESLTGLLFIALTTGLAFARFSRTTARIRFSEVATVHHYNGVPTLMFRLANERLNTILEARLRLFLALDERSLEGQTMRRLIPLTLSRGESIAFLIAWTAMHPIDGDSPLRQLGPRELEAARAELLVAFSGIDQTLERPIHARHHYPADRIRFGHRFVDMVDHRDGEMRLIDFSHFDRIRHCTERS